MRITLKRLLLSIDHFDGDYLKLTSLIKYSLEKKIEDLCFLFNDQVLPDQQTLKQQCPPHVIFEDKSGNAVNQITVRLMTKNDYQKDLLSILKTFVSDPSEHPVMEQTISKALGIGDIDLMIQLGGQNRLQSQFIWQLAYAELLFRSETWSTFSIQDYQQALENYFSRERRFGLTSAQVIEGKT